MQDQVSNPAQILLVICFQMLVFQAYWLVSTALFPKMIDRASDCYRKPFQTTLLGLAIIAPTSALGFFFMFGRDSAPIFIKVLGIAMGGAPLIFGLIGSAGLCQLIGNGLPASGDGDQVWRRIWRGGWVLNFCYILPVIGWFVALPLGIISGCGAFVMSLSKKGGGRRK